MAVEVFGNLPTTTVSSGGTDAPASGTQQTWTVASSAGFPAVSSSATPPTQIHIADVALNTEVISVINISGTTWTVIRGAESTTPVSHSAGFTIYQVVSAGGYAQLRSLSWLNVVTQFGAAGDGSTDDTAAIQAALNAVPPAGGTVYFPAGNYKVTTTLTPAVLLTYLTGDGMGATQVSSYVTGDCIRMYGTGNANSAPGGGITGMTVDGTHAGNGSAGVHAGDMFHPRFDFQVQNFTGTGSIGAWFDNNYSWMEQATGTVYAANCSNLVVFDNSANTSGGATGSFDRTVMDFFLISDGAGNGVTYRNGAFTHDGRLGIRGNFSVSATAVYSVLTVTGSNGGGFSRISGSVLNIGVELAGTTTNIPVTITFGTSGSNVIAGCAGVIDFAAHNTFTHAVNATNSFQFEGPVFGDTQLWRTQGGTNLFNAGTGLASGGNISTVNDVVTVSPTSNLTGMIMPKWGAQLGSPTRVTVINRSSGFTITMAASGTSNVANGTSCVILPDSSMAFWWDSFASLWEAPQPLNATGLYLPADVGLAAWNLDPLACENSATSAVNGTIYMMQVILRNAATITSGAFGIAAGATSATANQNYIALVDSAGAIQASTTAGAIDTATQSSGWFSQPFTTPYAAPAGKYWLAVLTNAGTPLKFAAMSGQGSAVFEAGVATAASFRVAVNGTGATALPGSFTMSSNSHTGVILFPVALS